MNDLPDELLESIFARCSAKSVARLELVCKRFRAVARETPVQVHVLPDTPGVVEWAKKHVVTKVTARRVWDFPTPDTLRVLDSLYSTIRLPALPRYLLRLRLSRVQTDRFEIFKVSSLPEFLKDVDITFDKSWRRIDVDRGIQKLTLRVFPKAGWTRYPDFLITHVDGVEELTLSTCGGITVVHPRQTHIKRARIECEDNHDPRPVLSLFGPSLTVLVMSMPRASILWSQDLAHLDPEVVALEVDFAGIDAIGSRLKLLELRVDRLAHIDLPGTIDLWVCVRNRVIDPGYFYV